MGVPHRNRRSAAFSLANQACATRVESRGPARVAVHLNNGYCRERLGWEIAPRTKITRICLSARRSSERARLCAV